MRLPIGADHAGFLLEERLRRKLPRRATRSPIGARMARRRAIIWSSPRRSGATTQAEPPSTESWCAGPGLVRRSRPIVLTACGRPPGRWKNRSGSREHNNANVLALGAWLLDEEAVERLVD